MFLVSVGVSVRWSQCHDKALPHMFFWARCKKLYSLPRLMHRCITAPIRWTLLLCCHSPRLPTDWLSPPPPSWSSYMSSAASLDCVSHSTSHLTHKQHTTKQVLWFFNPPSLYPLFNTNRNSVWCFAASCLQKKNKKCPDHSTISFPVRISWSQTHSQLIHPNPRFIPTLNSSRTRLCFPFPPAHKSLSYITGRQGDTLRCTTYSCCAHRQWAEASTERERVEGDGWRFLFSLQWELFCHINVAALGCWPVLFVVHCGVLILEH